MATDTKQIMEGMTANVERIVTAVNAFESNRELIRELVSALRHAHWRNHEYSESCAACKSVDYVLAKVHEVGL